MQSLFDYPRRALLALAVFLIATIFYSSWKLTFVATTGSMAALVMACTFLLLVLVVAGLGHVVAVLTPLLEARAGSGAGCATNVSRGSTHRQNLEQCVAREVIHVMSLTGDGEHAGKMARAALDALTGAGEQKALARTTDAQVEAMIQAKGKTAARVTPEDMKANIVDTEIVKHVSKTGQVLRWAVLTCSNGFAAVGKPSVSVSPENDDEDIGKQVAIDNSMESLWPLMGYALKTKLAGG